MKRSLSSKSVGRLCKYGRQREMGMGILQGRERERERERREREREKKTDNRDISICMACYFNDSTSDINNSQFVQSQHGWPPTDLARKCIRSRTKEQVLAVPRNRTYMVWPDKWSGWTRIQTNII
jgi:hypothetical protein